MGRLLIAPDVGLAITTANALSIFYARNNLELFWLARRVFYVRDKGAFVFARFSLQVLICSSSFEGRKCFKFGGLVLLSHWRQRIVQLH